MRPHFHSCFERTRLLFLDKHVQIYVFNFYSKIPLPRIFRLFYRDFQLALKMLSIPKISFQQNPLDIFQFPQIYPVFQGLFKFIHFILKVLIPGRAGSQNHGRATVGLSLKVGIRQEKFKKTFS